MSHRISEPSTLILRMCWGLTSHRTKLPRSQAILCLGGREAFSSEVQRKHAEEGLSSHQGCPRAAWVSRLFWGITASKEPSPSGETGLKRPSQIDGCGWVSQWLFSKGGRAALCPRRNVEFISPRPEALPIPTWLSAKLHSHQIKAGMIWTACRFIPG